MPKDTTCQICGQVLWKWWDVCGLFKKTKEKVVYAVGKKVVEHNGVKGEIEIGYVYYHLKCVNNKQNDNKVL